MFSKKTIEFLKGLEKNNSKKWFDAHRDDYQQHYVAPAKAFVEEMGTRFAKKHPEVHAEPRVNGSIFRINRDVRFSKDKSPYKPHLDLWFWEGSAKSRSRECAGYFFRMTPKTLILGAGMHMLDKKVLPRFRQAVADDVTGKALDKAINKVSKHAGVTIGGSHYKKVPRGFDADHPRAELLKHAGLFAETTVKLPKEATTPKFAAYCMKQFQQFTPLQQWLVELLSS